MSAGLKTWDASGRLTFDSTQTYGGACLGIFTIPAGGRSLLFPDFVGYTGIALSTGLGSALAGYSFDNTLGYLRFNFTNAKAGGEVILFAK